jgi:hypothetical protein
MLTLSSATIYYYPVHDTLRCYMDTHTLAMAPFARNTSLNVQRDRFEKKLHHRHVKLYLVGDDDPEQLVLGDGQHLVPALEVLLQEPVHAVHHHPLQHR